MNIEAVRNALARALADSVLEFNVYPYVSAMPTPPGFQILPPAAEFDLAMQRGLDRWTWTVQGFVALTSDIGSQQTLDELTDTGIVKDALEADPTLGGLVDDLRVTSQSTGRVVDSAGGSPMLLVEWALTILAKGS